jgi:hypothetical protein
MLDLAVPMAFVEEDEAASIGDDDGTIDVSMEPSVNAMATNTQEESMADIIDETTSTGNLGTIDDSMDLTNNSMETDTPGVDKHASIVDGKVLSDVVNDSVLITSLFSDEGSISMDITENVLSTNEEVSHRVSPIGTSESCSINTKLDSTKDFVRKTTDLDVMTRVEEKRHRHNKPKKARVEQIGVQGTIYVPINNYFPLS